jgi:hypothetical protein
MSHLCYFTDMIVQALLAYIKRGLVRVRFEILAVRISFTTSFHLGYPRRLHQSDPAPWQWPP